jgi:hypothetical protein
MSCFDGGACAATVHATSWSTSGLDRLIKWTFLSGHDLLLSTFIANRNRRLSEQICPANDLASEQLQLVAPAANPVETDDQRCVALTSFSARWPRSSSTFRQYSKVRDRSTSPEQPERFGVQSGFQRGQAHEQ